MKRIRITGFKDIAPLMKELSIDNPAEFFVVYEMKNRNMSRSEVNEKMNLVLSTMRDSVRRGLGRENFTASGMVSGGAYKVREFARSGKSLLSESFSALVYRTMAVSEGNACMERIVASPTAGAAGVVPGTLLFIAGKHDVSDERLLQALFIAGGVGEVISLRASVSGAVHGCQAEVGAASAMTAAALASLFTDDMKTIENAAAFALKNVLGLVCDPVAGLVEVPCIKRNVMGGVNAVAAAEMALAGIQTVIPLDEIIDAMAQIGSAMPSSLKETSLGGLAVTDTGADIFRKMKEEHL